MDAATTVLLTDRAAVLRVADRAMDDAWQRQAPQLGFLRLMNGVRADGRQANRELWTRFYAAMPDMEVTQEDLIISGDRVVGRYTYRGTQTGEFMGIPASGNPIEMRSIDIWRVDDGMFVEHWDELNVLEVFQQMGVIPPLGVTPIEAP